MHPNRAGKIEPASIQVVIPARNEEATIGAVILALMEQGIRRIRVVDNGSSDRTAHAARDVGAEVILEARLGYGQACWTGLQNLPEDTEWILFCDADGSDVLDELPVFFQAAGEADFVLGNRRSTPEGREAMTPAQDFGNWLATALIRLGWSQRYEDLGPLRLIRSTALKKINMEDRGFGWTVEMQARAVEEGLRIKEIPVHYGARRGGKSKISGTVKGTISAGTVILLTLAKLYARKCSRVLAKPWSQRILLSLSIALLVGGSFKMQSFGNFALPDTVQPFLLSAAIMNLGFGASFFLKAMRWWTFWVMILLTRLLLLTMFPSDDMWRYLWEGLIQHHGLSPYLFAPLAPELEHLRTIWWPHINHPEVPAVYPPLTELIFRCLTAFGPSVVLIKWSVIAADLGCCGLLQRAFGARAALLYAWNPLVIYSFAGGGHYDAWFLLAMIAGWLLLDKTQSKASFIAGALFLGISVALKYVTLPLVFYKAWECCRERHLQKAFVLCLLAMSPGLISFLVFSLCSGSVSFRPPQFTNIARSSEFLPYWAGLAWPVTIRMNWIYGLAVALAVPVLALARKQFVRFSEAYLAALLLLSPIVHAWYFTWLTPFAVKSRNLGAVLLSISGFVYFWLQHRQTNYGDWYQSVPLKLLLWMPLILGFAWHVRHESRVTETP